MKVCLGTKGRLGTKVLLGTKVFLGTKVWGFLQGTKVRRSKVRGTKVRLGTKIWEQKSSRDQTSRNKSPGIKSPGNESPSAQRIDCETPQLFELHIGQPLPSSFISFDTAASGAQWLGLGTPPYSQQKYKLSHLNTFFNGSLCTLDLKLDIVFWYRKKMQCFAVHTIYLFFSICLSLDYELHLYLSAAHS